MTIACIFLLDKILVSASAAAATTTAAAATSADMRNGCSNCTEGKF